MLIMRSYSFALALAIICWIHTAFSMHYYRAINCLSNSGNAGSACRHSALIAAYRSALPLIALFRPPVALIPGIPPGLLFYQFIPHSFAATRRIASWQAARRAHSIFRCCCQGRQLVAMRLALSIFPPICLRQPAAPLFHQVFRRIILRRPF